MCHQLPSLLHYNFFFSSYFGRTSENFSWLLDLSAQKLSARTTLKNFILFFRFFSFILVWSWVYSFKIVSLLKYVWQFWYKYSPKSKNHYHSSFITWLKRNYLDLQAKYSPQSPGPSSSWELEINGYSYLFSSTNCYMFTCNSLTYICHYYFL